MSPEPVARIDMCCGRNFAQPAVPSAGPVKPPLFKYHDPSSLEEALALLATLGEDARVLAGGQSLMPLLNFRMARPAHIVDINGIAELAEASEQANGLSLGAMVRQRELERSDVIGQACPLISQAMPLVGHPQIRNRGTLGGSLAHADPAAELPAVMLAVGANLVVQGKNHQRAIAADDFFSGLLTTALRPDELLVRVEVPRFPIQTGSSVQEVAMRVGDFALAGAVTCLTLDPGGLVSRARIVCFGIADRPLRMREAEASLEGRAPGDAALAEAGQLVSARMQPVEDIHASAAYRRRVCGVLVRRALAESRRKVRLGD